MRNIRANLHSAAKRVPGVLPTISRLDFEREKEQVNIFLETSTYCNLKCNFCPHPTHGAPLATMDRDFIRQILRTCRKVFLTSEYGWKKKQIKVCPVGLGEFFTHPDPIGVFEDIKETLPEAELTLDTNAVALSSEYSKSLCGGAYLDTLGISLNASDREAYTDICGADRFEKVVGNIREFLRVRDAVGVGPRLSFAMKKSGYAEGTSFREVDSKVRTLFPMLRRDDRVWLNTMLNWGGQVDDKYVDKTLEAVDWPCNQLAQDDILFRCSGEMLSCCSALAPVPGVEELSLGFFDGPETVVEAMRKKLAVRQQQFANGRLSTKPCRGCSSYTEPCYNAFPKNPFHKVFGPKYL